jgi:thioredoxin-related protein|tara:strand:- start:1935 stop:2435 length:501 start_codon:yes stop_codon:yes gene_type:complete
VRAAQAKWIIMKKMLLFLFLSCGSLIAQKSDQQINWLSWEQLESALAEKPKKTLIFFYADWCAYCKKIDRVVFTKPEVIKKINQDFYAVRMNAETTDTIIFDGTLFTNPLAKTQRNAVHQLAALLGSRENYAFSLPVTLFFDEQFKVKRRVFEYYTSEELMKYLNQ